MFSYVYLHWDNIDTLNNKQKTYIISVFSNRIYELPCDRIQLREIKLIF